MRISIMLLRGMSGASSEACLAQTLSGILYGASSGACLGHHLGHVWGNIWGITHPHPPHSHTHFQHTVGVHFLTSNTLMREKLQLHTQVAYLFQTKTSTISDIQHGHYLVLVPHVGPLHDPPGGFSFSSKPSIVHLCLLLLL